MLTIHKIPYELVTEVNIESKKCKDILKYQLLNCRNQKIILMKKHPGGI